MIKVKVRNKFRFFFFYFIIFPIKKKKVKNIIMMDIQDPTKIDIKSFTSNIALDNHPNLHPALFFFNQILSLSCCDLILRFLFALFFDLSVSGMHALKSSQISLSFPSLFNFYYYTFRSKFYFLSRKAKSKNHEFKLREIQLRLRSRNQIFPTQIPK